MPNASAGTVPVAADENVSKTAERFLWSRPSPSEDLSPDSYKVSRHCRWWRVKLTSAVLELQRCYRLRLGWQRLAFLSPQTILIICD
jgi:hypothetical protein